MTKLILFVFTALFVFVTISNGSNLPNDASSEEEGKMGQSWDIGEDIWNVSTIMRLADVFAVLNRHVVDQNLNGENNNLMFFNISNLTVFRSELSLAHFWINIFNVDT